MSENRNFTSYEYCLAGVSNGDSKTMNALLDDWDYTCKASARRAYSEPCIERLQLLCQIKGTLQNGLGFSNLYDMLEERRGAEDRRMAHSKGLKLQPWSGLVKSSTLREFIRKHQEYLGGAIDDFSEKDPKWYFHKIR